MLGESLKPDFLMNHQKLLSVFRRIQSCPTAPFHEYFVRDEIQNLLGDCPNVTLKNDDFGNLLATYRYGRKRPRFVFAAHMDHPGFVRSPRTGELEFLGGVPASYLELERPLREFGDFAMWDLLEFEVIGERVVSRVCDDLAGCAAIVCLFLELERLGVNATCHAVFTRAEEVGFVGALHLARNWPFGSEARFVSIETSAPVSSTQMGAGPVIRVGDGLSVFDDAVTNDLVLVAKEAGIPFQRALLDKGSCEATAMQFHGIPSAGLSILLGNYHNCGPGLMIEPEFIELADAKALVRLLVAAVEQAGSTSPARKAMAQRFELRIRQHADFQKATQVHFA